MSLREIESAIEKLDATEYERFCAWFEDREAQRKLQWLRSAVETAARQSERGERLEGRPAMQAIIERLDRRIAESEAS
jgi:hypothetical protein